MATALHRHSDQWPSFAIATEPVRLHMKNCSVPSCWMLQAASPLLFNSFTNSAVQLSGKSFRSSVVSQDKNGNSVTCFGRASDFSHLFCFFFFLYLDETYLHYKRVIVFVWICQAVFNKHMTTGCPVSPSKSLYYMVHSGMLCKGCLAASVCLCI